MKLILGLALCSIAIITHWTHCLSQSSFPQVVIYCVWNETYVLFFINVRGLLLPVAYGHREHPFATAILQSMVQWGKNGLQKVAIWRVKKDT